MNIKHIFLLGACLALVYTASANESWSLGVVTLNTGETVHGQLHFDYKLGIVHLKPDENPTNSRTFTTQNTAFFHYFDEAFKQERLFVTEEVEVSSKYNRPIFLEVLVRGDISILGLLKHENLRLLEQYKANTDDQRIYGDPVEYDFYMLKDDKVTQLSSFRKQTEPYFANFDQEIAHYIKKEKLATYNKWHQLIIISYYNELQQNKASDVGYSLYNSIGQ